MGALFVSHYLVVVFLLQLSGGVLLLLNRFIPLALLLLWACACEHSAISLLHGAGGFADGTVYPIVLWLRSCLQECDRPLRECSHIRVEA